jgi:hypothetical protein
MKKRIIDESGETSNDESDESDENDGKRNATHRSAHHDESCV